MDPAPEDLGDHVGIVAVVAEPPRHDRLGDRRAEERVSIMVGVVAVERECGGVGDGVRRHEHESVVVRMTHRELDVSQPGPPQPLDGVGDLRDPLEPRPELAEVFLADRVDQAFLAPEMVQDGRRGVVDRLGDHPERHRLVRMLDEQSPRRIEDLLTQGILLILATRFGRHDNPLPAPSPLRNLDAILLLTLLIYLTLLSKSRGAALEFGNSGDGTA